MRPAHGKERRRKRGEGRKNDQTDLLVDVLLGKEKKETRETRVVGGGLYTLGGHLARPMSTGGAVPHGETPALGAARFRGECGMARSRASSNEGG